MKFGDKQHVREIAKLDEAAGNWHSLPLYTVQMRALTDAAAAAELARRFSNEYNGGAKWYSERYMKRIAGAYLKGFNGEEEIKSGHRRGGNWNRPLADAFWNGQREKAAIILAAK